MNKKEFNQNGYNFSTTEGAKLAYMIAVLEASNLEIYNYINGLAVDAQINAINDMVQGVKAVDLNRGVRYAKTIKKWGERKNIVIKAPEGQIFGWSKGIAVLKDSDKRADTSATNGKKSTPKSSPTVAKSTTSTDSDNTDSDNTDSDNTDSAPTIVNLNDDTSDDDGHILTVDNAFDQLIENLDFDQLIELTAKLQQFTAQKVAA